MATMSDSYPQAVRCPPRNHGNVAINSEMSQSILEGHSDHNESRVEREEWYPKGESAFRYSMDHFRAWRVCSLHHIKKLACGRILITKRERDRLNVALLNEKAGDTP